MFNKPVDTAQFWSFSLDLYGAKGIMDLCLHLQDDHGADVNMILWFCWRSWVFGLEYDAALFDGAQEKLAPWKRRVLVPLREVRKRAKSDPLTYEALKVAELQAERCAQTKILEAETERPEQHGVQGKGARLSLCHQALRHYFVEHLAMPEGEAANAIDRFLTALKHL